jgi:uncharacterized membrane protein YdbT with pleckstrin-like domain
VRTDSSTDAGEQIFFHGHPSWRSILGFYIKGVVLTIIAGAIAGVVTRLAGRSVNVGIVAAVVAVALVVMILVGLIKRISTTYTISNRRLTITSGILTREMHEARLERVQNVNVTQSLLERMLRVGTVDFDTAASAEYDFKFGGVDNPRSIVGTVDQAIHAMQQAAPQGPGAYTPQPGATQPHAPGSDAV